MKKNDKEVKEGSKRGFRGVLEFSWKNFVKFSEVFLDFLKKRGLGKMAGELGVGW